MVSYHYLFSSFGHLLKVPLDNEETEARKGHLPVWSQQDVRADLNTCGASKPLFFLPSYSTLSQGSVLRQQAFANEIKQKQGPGLGRKSEKAREATGHPAPASAASQRRGDPGLISSSDGWGQVAVAMKRWHVLFRAGGNVCSMYMN